MQNQRLVRIGLIGFGVLVVLLLFGNSMFYTIQPGENAVVFKRFMGGLDKDNLRGQGFHVIMPWNKMIIYDVKQKELTEEMDVLSSNGLNIAIDVTLWYHPIEEKIGFLHERIGMDYKTQIVLPSIRSATRKVIGRYTPEEIYSTKRDEIAGEILEDVEKELSSKFVYVNNVLIRSVKLPANIKQAIETKLQQEQKSLEYEFKLQVAEKEAKRKVTEAEGEAKANQIINSSLTENLLRMRGIEATKELIKSENAKVIVIGGGDDGLPLILNGN